MAPVVKRSLSLASRTARSATASGGMSPTPIRLRERYASSCSSSLTPRLAARARTNCRNTGVSTWSALMAFTRIRSGPSSTAATRSAWSSAALLAP